MFGQIDEIKNLAFKYSKQQLGRMVQMGMIDPQKAMMAGMMRDRVAKEDTKPPTTTVAQDVLGEAPQVQQPAQPQQMGMPPQAAPQAPTQMAATGGITSLPVQEQDYAGGGIVAFADGGDTDDGVAHFYDGGTTSPMGRFVRGIGAVTPEQQATYAAQQEQQAREQALLARQNQLGGLFGLSQQTPEQQAEYEQIQRELVANRKGLNGIAPNQTFPTVANPNAPVTGSLDTTGNPFYTPPTPAADKTGASKAPAGTGGGPRLPALKEPSGKIDIEKYNAKPVQELDEITAEQKAAYIKGGYDPDMYKKFGEKDEGKRGEFSKRKEEAKGEFLMNLGLGLVGAKRGQEGEKLSESGIRATASYKEAMKDVRASEEKLDERLRTYAIADNQAKKTGTDAALAKRDRQKELVEAANIKNTEARNAANAEEAKIQANIYGTKTQAETARYVAGVQAATQRDYTAALKAQGLDVQRQRILIDAASDYVAKNGDKPAYMGKPDLLQADAIAFSKRLAAEMGVSIPGGGTQTIAPAPTADIYQKTYGITPTK
jgi:hypothetical protein